MNLFSRSRRKSKRSQKAGGRSPRRRRTSSTRLPWLLGGMAVIVVLGIGLLQWSRSGTGQAALLTLGSNKMYDEVQRAVEESLVPVLPGFVAGPVHAAGKEAAERGFDFDWAAPELGAAAAVRCRVVAVTDGALYWEWQERIANAVEAVGAKILWCERIFPARPPEDQRQPNEERDVLRVDIGVQGRPTHTILLYRPEHEPQVTWGDGPGTSAWSLLAADPAPTIAIMIDDWGHGRTEACRSLLALNAPFTLAVLPGLPYSRHYTLMGTDLILPTGGVPGKDPREMKDGRPQGRNEAREATGCFVEVQVGKRKFTLDPRRRETMLHLPMEPQGYPATDPGPRAILVGMREEDIARRLDDALTAMPGITGINNHMGSAATSDEGTMKTLMKVLAARDLFFIDSLTSANSVAHAEAGRAGLATARNRIFLDYDSENQVTIKANLEVLVRTARSSGFALGIGHPHRATAAVLAREIPRLQREGVRFVTVSEFLALKAWHDEH